MKFLVRLSGEIALKSQAVRRQFQNRLFANIREALAGESLAVKLSPGWGRFYLEGANDQDAAKVATILKQTFGVRSFSQVEYECEADMPSMCQLVEHYRELVAGKTFAVKARRTGEHMFSSMDVQKELGAVLCRAGGQVSLTKPQVAIYIEVRDQRSFFYTHGEKGPGGLPLGTGGRAVCLLSGGFDSAVAAWMMQKRGVGMEYLVCNLAGKAFESSVLRVAKILADRWSYGLKPYLHVVDLHEIVAQIKDRVSPRYSQVVLKRVFYRLGAMLAHECHGDALVTGEAIGQVSSQTLANLRAIDAVAPLPVMRPLIASDKEEIVALSREIGTFAASAPIQEFCQLMPVKPVTACHSAALDQEEAKLDGSLLAQAFAARKSLNLRELKLESLLTANLYSDHIPDGAVVIDCRPRADFDAWHLPQALHHDYFDLQKHYREFPKDKTYILYCAVGMQTSMLAEKMQADGYLAYSLQGGVRGLSGASQC